MYDYPRNSMSRGTKLRGSQHPERDSSSPMQIRSQQQQAASSGSVAILWDMENCPVPSEVKPDEVAGNVRKALQHSMIQGAVTLFSAYGDFAHISTKVRQGCQRTGVNLIDVPNGKKDASDKAILVDLFLYALDNRPPCTIVLISGDVDFAPALHKLGQRGYTVALAIPSGVGVSPALCTAGRFVWDWPSVARGALVPPAKSTNFKGANLGDRPTEIPSSRGIADGRMPEASSWGGSDERVAEVIEMSGFIGHPKPFASPSDDSDLNGDEATTCEEKIVWKSSNRFADHYVSTSVAPISKFDTLRRTPNASSASRSFAHGKRPQDVNAVVPRELGKLAPVARAMSPAVRRPQPDTASSSRPTGSSQNTTFQAANLHVLKEQLLKLVGYNGSKLELTRVPAEYQELFGKPLAEYGNNGTKLMNILEKLRDLIFTRGEGASTTLHLTRNGSRAYGRAFGKLRKDAKSSRNVSAEDIAVSDIAKPQSEDVIDIADEGAGDEIVTMVRAPQTMQTLFEDLQALDVNPSRGTAHQESNENQCPRYDWDLGSGGSGDEKDYDEQDEKDVEVDESTLEEVAKPGGKKTASLSILGMFKMELQELLISHAWRIQVSEFLKMYEQRYSRHLDYAKFGVDDLESLIEKVGDVATISEKSGSKELVGLFG